MQLSMAGLLYQVSLLVVSVKHHAATSAYYLCVLNPGCLLQLLSFQLKQLGKHVPFVAHGG